MKELLNEYLYTDVTNIVSEYLNGDKKYWKSQYNFVLMEIDEIQCCSVDGIHVLLDCMECKMKLHIRWCICHKKYGIQFYSPIK